MQMRKEQIEQLFRQHYPRMYQLALVLLKDEAASKDVVSDVFADVLDGDVELLPDKARSYLLVCVRNKCLTLINRQKMKDRVHHLLQLDASPTIEPAEATIAAIDLDKSSSRYKISFIYNELEDFTVTQNVNEQNIPDAIRRVIGFYPMKMTVGDSLITVECIRKGERKLIGRLMDNHNLPVEFANVQLLSAKDSSFLCGGVSNANGDFVIPCEQKQAIMKVSYVGYKTISRLVTIGRMGIIRMQADAYQLKRVVVKGNLRTDRGDHAIYTFNEEQIKNVRHTQDLITNIPGIITDPVTGKTRSIVNKKLKILINGVNYPPIANLNENTTIIIPGVVNQGNPNLTSNNEYGAFLRINHYSSWLQGQLTFFGVYTDSR